MGEAARRVLLLGPLGHTTHSVGSVRSTGALGNEEGESGLPPAAVDGAQPTTTATRRARFTSGALQ